MSQLLQYTNQTVIGPSPEIWHDCPVESILGDPSRGLYHFDDFLARPTSDALGSIVLGGTATAVLAGAQFGGILNLVTSATDNESVYMVLGSHDQAGGAFLLDAEAGQGSSLWFECRMKSSLVGDVAFLLGLGGAVSGAMAVAATLADNTGILQATKDFIGFNSVTGAPTALRAAYQAASQTQQLPNATAHTLVADTYFKAGFKVNMDDARNQVVKWFINNVQIATATLANAQAVTFPEDVALTPIIGVKQGVASIHTVSIDWWRAAQLRAA